MTTTNHWGKWVDSNSAITGVHSIHDLNWDTYPYWDEICPICEENLRECEEHALETGEEVDYDQLECDSSHQKLMGDWVLDTNTNQWDVNKAGDEGYSALMNEDTIQVIWSRWTERHALCSPCYPGQADVDSKGEFLCYVLPPELRGE